MVPSRFRRTRSHRLSRRLRAGRLVGIESRRQIQSPRYRQPSELDITVDAELTFDLVVQIVDGLDAEMQPLRDFVYAGGRDQHAKHVELARREVFQRPTSAWKSSERQRLRNIGTEHMAAKQ